MADNKHRVQITIAIIGLIGVVLAATISNWDKISRPANQITEDEKPYSQKSSGSNSPNVSNVKGDVSINIKDEKPTANTSYLSTLIGKEPFSEQLPEPLVSTGFEYVQINDTSASRRLSAVQLRLSLDQKTARALDPENGFSDLQTFAHIEVYKSKQDALERSKASRALLVARYPEGVGLEPTTNKTFCINGDPDFWTCAGSRGFAYAEVTLSPGSNANLGIANGTLSAMLKYADKVTALATNQPE